MIGKTPFEINRFVEINKRPEDFDLIERVPLTKPNAQFPIVYRDSKPTDLSIVLLDTETTGLDQKKDEIIELGLTLIKACPKDGSIQQIARVESYYREPENASISEFITALTGIKAEDVKGKRLKYDDISDWFTDDPIILAHNAQFDRGFIDKTFPEMRSLRWGCSRTLNWRALGFESPKLEYLVLKSGYFYAGHRASTDTLAMAWLFIKQPTALIENIAQVFANNAIIEATGSPFDCKDQLRQNQYRWNPAKKVWFKTVAVESTAEEQAFLSSLYANGGELATINHIDARVRFK